MRSEGFFAGLRVSGCLIEWYKSKSCPVFIYQTWFKTILLSLSFLCACLIILVFVHIHVPIAVPADHHDGLVYWKQVHNQQALQVGLRRICDLFPDCIAFFCVVIRFFPANFAYFFWKKKHKIIKSYTENISNLQGFLTGFQCFIMKK